MARRAADRGGFGVTWSDFMPPETFYGLSAMQLQGWAAIASLVLTAALVATTIVYARLTRRIANAAEEARRAAVKTAEIEQQERLTGLGWALSSMKQGLKEVLEGDFVDKVAYGRLTRVPGIRLPVELLARFSSHGASIQVVTQLGSMLHNIELGEHCLAMIPAPVTANEPNKELMARAEAYFRQALADAVTCIDLLNEARILA